MLHVPSFRLMAEALQQYAGTYEAAPEVRFNFKSEGDTLYASAGG